MQRKIRLAAQVAVLAVPLLEGSLAGAEAPKPVAPHKPTSIAAVSRTCPTFTWSAAGGAERVELAVFSVDALGTPSAEPLLSVELPGSAQTWVPSLESCLEPGLRYAWTVRALKKESASPWSEPSLFDVVAAPSSEEVRSALATLERYLDSAPTEPARPRKSAPPAPAAAAGTAEQRTAEARPGSSGMTPPSVVVDGTYEFSTPRVGRVSVPGNSFISYGDGSAYKLSRNVAGYSFVSSGPISPHVVNMGAAINLPNAVTVTELVCFYYDNDDSASLSGSIQLWRKAPDSSGANDPMVEMNISTTIGQESGVVLQTQNLSITSPIASSLNHYYLFVNWSQSQATSNIRFYGCDVVYNYSLLLH